MVSRAFNLMFKTQLNTLISMLQFKNICTCFYIPINTEEVLCKTFNAFITFSCGNFDKCTIGLWLFTIFMHTSVVHSMCVPRFVICN